MLYCNLHRSLLAIAGRSHAQEWAKWQDAVRREEHTVPAFFALPLLHLVHILFATLSAKSNLSWLCLCIKEAATEAGKSSEGCGSPIKSQ